jgi:pyridoxamine 5'-phosphate oxidase
MHGKKRAKGRAPVPTGGARALRDHTQDSRSHVTAGSAALQRCPADPVVLFKRWYREAAGAGTLLPQAAALATATRDGRPSVRMVLHRGFSRGGFVFYTNYDSRKAADLAENPRAALVFHWPQLERQVRVEGRVEKISRAESARYFQTRPRDSRISAWASPQSATIPGRAFLEEAFARTLERFGDRRIPCPPFWGGFRIVASCIEFWQGQPHRLHDRVMYRRKAHGWNTFRLGP